MLVLNIISTSLVNIDENLFIKYFSDEKISFLADITGEKNEAYVVNAGTKIFIDSDISMRIYLRKC